MLCFQNCQTNTCKNEPAKPVFMRVSRGYRRNEKSPLRALTHCNILLFLSFSMMNVEMKKSPLRLLKFSFDQILRETSLWQNSENFVLDFLVFILKTLDKKRELLLDCKNLKVALDIYRARVRHLSNSKPKYAFTRFCLWDCRNFSFR